MAIQQQTFEFLASHQVATRSSGSLAGNQGADSQGSMAAKRSPVESPPAPASAGAGEAQANAEAKGAEGGGVKGVVDGEADRSAVLRQLRSKAGCISTAPGANQHATFSTGSAAIDCWLPGEGLRIDAITEWVAQADGSGAATLSLIAAANLLRDQDRGPLVVVSDVEHFYPPAAVALGIPAERLVWVRPKRHADVIWSIDQALRCEAVAAVWAPLGTGLDDRDARRFQLAAEAGRTPGLFLRPMATRHRPSFAEVRFYISNRSAAQALVSGHLPDNGRLLQVTLDRCRGGRLGEKTWIQIRDQGDIVTVHLRSQDEELTQNTVLTEEVGKHEKAAVHLASKLAHPKISPRRAKRA